MSLCAHTSIEKLKSANALPYTTGGHRALKKNNNFCDAPKPRCEIVAKKCFSEKKKKPHFFFQLGQQYLKVKQT